MTGLWKYHAQLSVLGPFHLGQARNPYLFVLDFGDKYKDRYYVGLFVLMLYVPINNFSVMSGCFPVSWVEPVLSRG